MGADQLSPGVTVNPVCHNSRDLSSEPRRPWQKKIALRSTVGKEFQSWVIGWRSQKRHITWDGGRRSILSGYADAVRLRDCEQAFLLSTWLSHGVPASGKLSIGLTSGTSLFAPIDKAEKAAVFGA